MIDLVALHKKVWDFRHSVEDKWPTPGPLECLRFAVTEMGEVMDAYMRQDPRWVRNNHKHVDMHAELGDLALMLLSAIPENSDYLSQYIGADIPASIDDLAMSVACTLFYKKHGEGSLATILIIKNLYTISMLTNIDLQLDRCIEKLREKHG